jgi:inosine/xanthosine triphosphatase
MMISIGTKNKAKIQALQEVLRSMPYFKEFQMASFSVPSGIREQPLSLEETILGAKNRAYQAFLQSGSQADYSFGIESGLIEAIGTRTGFMNICACTIYNGVEYYTGLSSGFEVPSVVLKHVLEDKLDLTQACLASGISCNERIGEEEGLIGILTNRKVNRLEYTKESIHSALIQIMYENQFAVSPPSIK